jgi:hypothetical protein
MSTPPCTAITKAGKPCGKVTGTTPTPDGPRCYTHLAKAKRLADPHSRQPVKNPQTRDDLQRNLVWCMDRASQDKLSAPAANAYKAVAMVWLRNLAETERRLAGEALDALSDLTEALPPNIPPELMEKVRKASVALLKLGGEKVSPVFAEPDEDEDTLPAPGDERDYGEHLG